MTVATAIGKIRRLAQTNVTGCSNQLLLERINEAQKEFAKAVKTLTKEEYVTITPLFDLQTHFAIRLTIVGGANELAATDIAITAADAADQTGTQAATALQTAIQAAITAAGGTPSLTVAWSTTTWTFTVDGIDCTSITVAEPSGITYAPALELLGLSAATTTGTSVTGDIPVACTLESPLPTDFLSLATDPEWNGYRMSNAPMQNFLSPKGQGTPTMYFIRNKRIMLSPPPNEMGELHIYYKYVPAAFTSAVGYQEFGLSGKALNTATGLSATTTYYLKVAIDGGAVTEYSITTASSLTFEYIIDLLNTAVRGVTFSIEEGDLRCSSDTVGAASAIAITAGTTGTDLLATLTDFAAMETAVATNAGDELNVDDEWAMAVVYYAAAMLAEENYEKTTRDGYLAQFTRITRDFIVERSNNNTALFPQGAAYPPNWPKVDFGD